VQVVGQPLFDATVQAARRAGPPRDAPDQPHRVLYLAADFATGFRDPEAARAQLADIRLLCRLLAESFGDHWELVVRPHPLEGPELFAAVAEIGPNARVDGSSTLQEAITASQLVVSNVSSASLAAIVARWPCFLFAVNLGGGRYGRIMRMFPCLRATTPAAARRLVQTLDDSARREHWVARNAQLAAAYVYVDPERSAAELVVRLLQHAAGRRTRQSSAPPGSAP
jgi:hypothetical protein